MSMQDKTKEYKTRQRITLHYNYNTRNTIEVLLMTSIFLQPRKSQNVPNFWGYVLQNPDRYKSVQCCFRGWTETECSFLKKKNCQEMDKIPAKWKQLKCLFIQKLSLLPRTKFPFKKLTLLDEPPWSCLVLAYCFWLKTMFGRAGVFFFLVKFSLSKCEFRTCWY